MRDDTFILCGNLTAAPVLRKTKTSGKSVVNLRVARNYPEDSNGNQRPTSFFDIEVWEHMAENVAHLPKGARIIVIGHFKSDQWTSEDGTVHHGFRIVAEEVGPSGRFSPVFSGYSKNTDNSSEEVSRLSLPDTDEDF